MKEYKKSNLISLGQYSLELPFLIRLSTANSLIHDVEAFLDQVSNVSKLDSINPNFHLLEKQAHWGLALLRMDDYSTKALLSIYYDYENKIRDFNEAITKSSDPVYTGEQEQLIREALKKAGVIDNSIKEMMGQCNTEALNALEKTKNASNIFWKGTNRSYGSSENNIKLFMCHSTLDKRLAVEICREIESVGISTWRDDKDIGGGDSIPAEISKGLDSASHFTIILSDSSIDRPWVNTELANAIMLRNEKGSPKIIPILLDGLNPPLPITDLKGIDFDEFDKGLDDLFKSLGIKQADRVDLTSLYHFYRKSEKALETLSWCNQADSFMTIDEEYFEQLEEIEQFFDTIGMPQELNTPKRYIRTLIRNSENMTIPAYDDEFYTYKHCAFAGISLTRKISYYGKKMANILERSSLEAKKQ